MQRGMLRILSAATAIAIAITTAACGGSKSSTGPNVTSSATAAPSTSGPARPTALSVSLVWSRFPLTDGSSPAAYYVARITNPANTPAAEVLNTLVLDASGTIVGSSQDVLPLIRAHTQFDFFGAIGNFGFGAALTGTPASVKVQMSKATDAGGGQPMLATSELKLTKGGPDTFTNAPGTYDLTVKVTNSTTQTISFGVTQQTVLYDQAGNVVGGDSGSSDNVPDSLPPGMSYRESWTGIATWGTVARAGYTVWPAG